jgi:hypothetical protein
LPVISLLQAILSIHQQPQDNPPNILFPPGSNIQYSSSNEELKLLTEDLKTIQPENKEITNRKSSLNTVKSGYHSSAL